MTAKQAAAGATPRPWKAARQAGLRPYRTFDDQVFIVYAVNHIEAAEARVAALEEALRALRLATDAYLPDRLDAAMRLEEAEHEADALLEPQP